jgi:hypothetical protein
VATDPTISHNPGMQYGPMNSLFNTGEGTTTLSITTLSMTIKTQDT